MIFLSGKLTVLIADDEAAIRTGLCEVVSRLPIELEIAGCATNGMEALQLLSTMRIDIAVMDINMPVMDGLSVIQHAQQKNLSTRFLILSGYEDFSYAQTAIRYGVKSYFLKPLNIDEFRTVFLQQCQEIQAQHNQQIESNETLSQLVDSSRTLFLNRLVQNRADSAYITTSLSSLGLDITQSACRVAVYAFTSTDTHLCIPVEEIERKLLRPLFKKYGAESWMCESAQIAVLFNVAQITDDAVRQLLHMGMQLLQSHSITAFVALGDPVRDLSSAGKSFSCALEALSYRIYRPNVEIFDSSLFSKEKPAFSRESIDFAPLVDSILQHDNHGIAEYCEGFFRSLLFKSMSPPSFLIGMCIYLILNTQKQVALTQPDSSVSFDFSYDEINALESVEAIQGWMTAFFIQYSEMLKDNSGDQNAIIQSAKEYIQQNLSTNLKAKDVAAHINLSESYFTVYFKDKTGINFRDYLLKARMQLAKQLLKSHNVNISEIAYQTGYQDYRSFSRAFKNETGMTPSEYQNQG